MKILVCGSRDWDDFDAIANRLCKYAADILPVVILHGGAAGADGIAGAAARLLRFEVRVFRPDWSEHGKRAGILRNLQMLDEQPDLVIAFQRNGSRGTQHTINEARRRGIPVEVHTA
jgi:cell division ATPase FtsA